jgi:hypothetical protein
MERVEIAVVGATEESRLSIARAMDSAPADWLIGFCDGIPSPDVLCVTVGDVAAPADSIRFDPSDPGALVPSIAERLAAASSRTVVVTSAMRGCGVTAIALHLAAAVACDGQTCFVDLDTSWGAKARLRLPDDSLTWATGRVPDCALPVAGGFRAALSPGDGTIPPVSLVSDLGSAFDRLVVDSPGMERAPEYRVHAGIMVLPPSGEGACRTRALLEKMSELRWICVANRPGPGGEITRPEIERILGRSIALELPCTPALRDVEGERLLTSPWHRWVRRLHALGREVFT